jgi:outer membrane biogenesis lipoprotein LolB
VQALAIFNLYLITGDSSMMKKTVLTVVAVTALLLTGCATVKPEYAFVVDQDQVSKEDNLKRQQRQVAHVVWINPPVRKVALAEQPKP